jgi:preprotein translocase subunit SecD
MLKQYHVLTLLICLVLGCSESNPTTIEFRLAEAEAAPGLTETVLDPSGERLYLHDIVVIDQQSVSSAAVSMSEAGASIELVLTSEGARRFEEWTGMNVGQLCGIVVNGKLVSAPRINAPIRGGRTLITGDFTEAEARRIADGLSGR